MMGSPMKSAHAKVLIGLMLALAACSEGDRRFLLTYEHPKNERAAATMAAAEAQPQAPAANAAAAIPSPAPTQPVTEAPAPAVTVDPPAVAPAAAPEQAV